MLLLLTCIVFGIGFGLLLHKLFGKTGNEQTLTKENQQLKDEFDRYRSQVNDHFSTSAELFEKVSDDYRRLLGHMADGTSNLNVELPERLLADFEVAPTPLKGPDDQQTPDEEQSPDAQTQQSAHSAVQDTDTPNTPADSETIGVSQSQQSMEPPADVESIQTPDTAESDTTKQ